MVKAGVANFLMKFTAKPTVEDEVVVTLVGDCDEIQRYLRLLEIPMVTYAGHGQDILYWWKAHATEFPNLLKMARKFLAAPASSAASAERMYLADGKMHDELKKNTSEETLEDMLAVTKNFPDA